MKLVAVLLALYVVCVWARYLRRRFDPLFLVPALCVTAMQVFQIG